MSAGGGCQTFPRQNFGRQNSAPTFLITQPLHFVCGAARSSRKNTPLIVIILVTDAMNASEIVSVALEPVHPLYMWQHKARVNMVKVNAHNDMLMYDGSRNMALS